MAHLYHTNFIKILILLSLLTLHFKGDSQTFNGVGGLPFPPSGTIGITESDCVVNGVGVLGSCNVIENVTINLDHTWDGDIALFLIAPDGTFIELSSSNGGPNDNYTNTVFSDNALINIVSGAPPYTGTFKPEGRQNTTINNPYPNGGIPGTFTFQNTFTGINADGTWKLYLNDYVGGDVGFLHSWSMTFSNTGTSFTVDIGPDTEICAGEDIMLTATNTAPNPTMYQWSTGQNTQSINLINVTNSGVYTVTVTDASGCTSTDEISIIVLPSPNGMPVTYERCESAPPGNADFDLTSIINSIGGGLPVTFYTDMALTNEILNLTPFNSPSTTIYAVVSNGNCVSGPIPITLDVTINNPSLFDMNIIQDELCGAGIMEVFFNFPVPGTYTYAYELDCTSSNVMNTITTNANPVLINVSDDCTLRIFSITEVSSGCITEFIPPLEDDIIVSDLPFINVNLIEICPGESVDLNNYVSTDAGALLTFHSSTPPSIGNQLPSSIVSPTVTTVYYANSLLNNCNQIANVIVNVLPGGASFDLSITVCENAGSVNLNNYVNPPSLTGVWSGTGVVGNNFIPTGLSGTIMLTFDPDNDCYDNGSLTIQISEDLGVNLLTQDICQSDMPLNLSSLQDPLVPNGTWSGPGVNNNFFDPSNQTGVVTLTFIPSDICISSETTTITILQGPDVQLANNVQVCMGESINLLDYVLNIGGNQVKIYASLPLISANELINTNVTINQNTSYYVQLIDGNGCYEVDVLNVIVSPGGIPMLGSVTLCQNEGSYNLQFLVDPQAPDGVWSGTGVTNNILDLTNLSGIITLTFVPNASCYQEATTLVEIVDDVTPILTTTEMCSNFGNYNLIGLTDANFPNGSWSGPGVSNNIFNPQNLSGVITLVFASDQFCVNPQTTTITVTAAQTPILGSLQVCENIEIVDLNTLLDPNFLTGTWSGNGVTGNTFETAGLLGNNVVVFQSDQNCVLPSSTTISVNQLIIPQLLPIEICESADPISLVAYQDPMYPNGIWSGMGVNNNIFNPEGLEGIVSLVYTTSITCANSTQTQAVVHGTPNVQNIMTTCDQSTQSYTVSFSISGGDDNTYMVNGIASGLNFTSVSFPSMSSYVFTIEDGNQCDIITIQGSKNCDCLTDAGTLNIPTTPVLACENETVLAEYNNDGALEDDDRLLFVLHDGNGVVLGNIYGISSVPQFGFPNNGVLGTTYYISAVVADSIGLDSVDFADECLSVSAGVPIVFYRPSITINQLSDICIEDCQDIEFVSTGVAPFHFVVSYVFANNVTVFDTVTTINSSHVMSFCPKDYGDVSGNATISIVNFEDGNCEGDASMAVQQIGVNPKREATVNNTLCMGEEIVINGNTYNESNPMGIESIPSIVPGVCDSVIVIDLRFIPIDTIIIDDTICNTQSILVNGNIYDQNNPSGIEIIQGGNQYGCDSIISIQLHFTNEIVIPMDQTLCDGENIVVNGTVYDVTNPMGTELIASSNPAYCDTIIMVNLTFLPKSVGNIDNTLCYDESLVVNGNVYSENNPSGQEILVGADSHGCDSIVNVNLNFLPEAKYMVTDTICDGDSIVIQGISYHQGNPTGMYVLANGSYTGCDSTITVNLSFFDRQIDTLRLSILKGGAIDYNGVTFSESKRNGLTTNVVLSVHGCLTYTYVIVDVLQDDMIVNYRLIHETCPGLGDGQLIIDSITGCGNYAIVFGNDLVENPIFPVLFDDISPGNYQLKVTGDVDCNYVENIEVLASTAEGFSLDKAMFTILKGMTMLLDVGIQPTPETIAWTPSTLLDCGDCLVPTFLNPQESVEFILALTDTGGCTFEYTVSVNLKVIKKDIVFPNVFTPNGDGRNDNWEVLFTENQRVINLYLYDRWGNQVFRDQPKLDQTTIDWDGRLNGQFVAEGVYVYMAEVINDDGFVNFVSGDVTLIR